MLPRGERAPRAARRVSAGVPGGLPEPGPAAPAAGLGRLDDRQLGIRDRARRLCLQRRRRAAVGLVGLLRFLPAAIAAPFVGRWPTAFRASGSCWLGSDPARGDGRGGCRGALGLGRRLRLRAAARSRRSRPLSARRRPRFPLARAHAPGADRRERRVEHDRERRRLPRPGSRRPAARRDEPRRRLRGDGGDLRLVGAPGRADPPERARRARRPKRLARQALDGFRRSPSTRSACWSACTPRRRWSPARSTCSSS